MADSWETTSGIPVATRALLWVVLCLNSPSYAYVCDMWTCSQGLNSSLLCLCFNACWAAQLKCVEPETPHLHWSCCRCCCHFMSVFTVVVKWLMTYQTVFVPPQWMLYKSFPMRSTRRRVTLAAYCWCRYQATYVSANQGHVATSRLFCIDLQFYVVTALCSCSG